MRIKTVGNWLTRYLSKITLFFLACCKGQIVIHTTKVDGTEIEDIEENVRKDL